MEVLINDGRRSYSLRGMVKLLYVLQMKKQGR